MEAAPCNSGTSDEFVMITAYTAQLRLEIDISNFLLRNAEFVILKWAAGYVVNGEG